jgi:inorganic pyrophosphatase
MLPPRAFRFRAVALCVALFAALIWLQRRASGPAADPSRLPTVPLSAGASTYLHRAPAAAAPSLLAPIFGAPPPRALARVSPWHGLPLREGRAGAGSPAGEDVVTFVCEVPHGGTAKLEVQLGAPLNPLAQDRDKGGAARFYPWRSLLNYGMLPRTYEDPEAGGAGGVAQPGDGDPLDAMDLWPLPCAPGEAYRARVVGALAMLDEGRTDWKVFVVRDNGGVPADVLRDVAELLPQLESMAGDAAADAAGGDAPPAALVVQLRAGGGGAAAPAAAPRAPRTGSAAAAVALAAAVTAALPAPPLARELADRLQRLPVAEGDDGWQRALPRGADAPAAAFAPPPPPPRGGVAPAPAPGATHATAPPALLPALRRAEAGGALDPEEARVLRLSVKTWAARRLVAVREWLSGYKAAAAGGGAPRAAMEFGGAFLDAASASRVVDDAHAAYLAALGKIEARYGLVREEGAGGAAGA